MRPGLSDRERLLEIADVEVADAPGPDLPRSLELLERAEGVLERMRPRPVEQVAVEPVGLEARQALLAGPQSPLVRGAWLGITFETRNTSSRCPAMASRTSSSTLTGAVERPRCRGASGRGRGPAASAATAEARSSLSSMFHVPWPIDATTGPARPKLRSCIMVQHTVREGRAKEATRPSSL